MSNHKGSEGSVEIGANAVAELKAWNMTESSNTIDDSNLQDDWATKKGGQKSWAGSLECFWDETDATGQGALVNGAEVTLNLYPEGSVIGDTFYTGLVIVTNIERGAAIDGMVEASFSFEGNGAVIESTV